MKTRTAKTQTAKPQDTITRFEKENNIALNGKKLLTNNQINIKFKDWYFDKKDLIEYYNIKNTFDYAMPETWLHTIEPKEDQRIIYNGIVWYYGFDRIFGSPLPLTKEAYITLKKHDCIK